MSIITDFPPFIFVFPMIFVDNDLFSFLIGEEAMLMHGEERYHWSCVTCERCHLKLREKDYLVCDKKFYCFKVSLAPSLFLFSFYFPFLCSPSLSRCKRLIFVNACIVVLIARVLHLEYCNGHSDELIYKIYFILLLLLFLFLSRGCFRIVGSELLFLIGIFEGLWSRVWRRGAQEGSGGYQ